MYSRALTAVLVAAAFALPAAADALTDALASNTAYANIHTMAFPAGEIRGEIRPGDDDDDR
jgi:hypothetical protein